MAGERPCLLQYVRDLGLVTRSGPVAVANPIYREVIPRDLTYTTQEMSIHHDPAWYVGDDGALRVGELLGAFQAFFREHSEHWVERAQAGESGTTQKVVIECKVLHRGLERTVREGLAQTRACMDRSGAAEGHLVVFDRTQGRSWDEKIFRHDEVEGGVPVTVWGM